MIPFPVAGQSSGHKSVRYSSEMTQNMYLDKAEGRSGVHDFPGLKPWVTKVGNDRGFHVMAKELYQLSGNTLYKISSLGVTSSLGTVAGLDRAIFADDGSNLYFVVEGLIYKYNGTLTTVTQTVVTNPSSIAYLNRKFILTGDGGLFATSNPADGDTYNALNFAEAETQPDPLLRCYIFNQLAYMLGSKTTELWYDAGTGNPPLQRQDTALVNRGIAGKYAVTNTDQFMYWLGDDRQAYQCIGANARTISTPGISHFIEEYPTVSDCIASTLVYDGQHFIIFAFPTANKTLCYSETYQYWVDLGGEDRWYGNSAIRVYEQTIIADHRNGNLYELDPDTYTDNGDTRIRIRTLPSFLGSMVRAPGKRITVKQVRINMEVGVGLETGQGVNPVLMCEFSPDGGLTWQAEQFVSMGELGDYMIPVDFWDFATGYEVRCRISCSDPVYLSMFDGQVDIELAGF